MNIWIVFRHGLHDRTLRKSNADDQIIAALSKGAHRRLDRYRIARLDVAKHNVESGFPATRLTVGEHSRFSALHPGPGGGIEGTIVFTADVKDDTDVNFGFVIGAIKPAVAGLTGEDE